MENKMKNQTPKRNEKWYVDVNDDKTVKAFERLIKAIQEETSDDDFIDDDLLFAENDDETA